MLVLSRKVGQEIVIGHNVRLTVVAVRGDKVRLGFVAPPDVPILRYELRAPAANAPVAHVNGARPDPEAFPFGVHVAFDDR